MPNSTPHIQQVRVESKTLPVRERIEQTSARGDITVSPCGGISITVSLDRPNETITLSAKDARDSNASFVYKKEGGTYDGTTTYGPYSEGEQVFFVKEQNKNCVFKVTKEVIHCDITISSITVEDETYDDSTGKIEATVETPSSTVEWSFDGGAWFESTKTYEWTGLDDGTYLIEVRDEWGCTASQTVTVSNTADTFAPSIPQNITIQDRADGEAALLDWDDSVDDETSVDHYTVYRSTTQGFTIGSGNVLADNLSTSDYEDTSVVHGTTYYYKITATDARGNESSPSTEKQFTFIDDVAPQAPSNLSGTVSDNTVSLDWDTSTSPDVVHYNIYQDAVKVTQSTDTVEDITGLTNGQDYDFFVTAVDEAGNESPASNIINKTPKDTTPPAAPTGLVGSYDSSNIQIDLSWDANTESDFTHYNIYRSTTSGGPYTEISSSDITVESYTDGNISEGTTYYYVVTAVDDDGLESNYSNEVQVTATGVIKVGFQFDATSISNNLTGFPLLIRLEDFQQNIWENDPGEGSFRVEDSNGNKLPYEITDFDLLNQKGNIYFKSDVTAGSINDFNLVVDVTLSKPTNTDTLGRNNVWTEYEAVYHFNEDPATTTIDSTGNGYDASPVGGLDSNNQVAGYIDKAVEPQADGEALETAKDLDFGANPMSFQALVNIPLSADDDAFFGKNINDINVDDAFDINNGANWRVKGGNEVPMSDTSWANEWTVTGFRYSTDYHFYIDDVLDNSNTVAGGTNIVNTFLTKADSALLRQRMYGPAGEFRFAKQDLGDMWFKYTARNIKRIGNIFDLSIENTTLDVYVRDTTTSSVDIDIDYSNYSIVTSFEIYRSTTSGSGFSKIDSVSATSDIIYTDSTVSSGTTYYYKIRAVDEYGTYKESREMRATAEATDTSTVTVSSSSIPSDLTGFPLWIDLSDLPSSFWNTVSSDGSDIRAIDENDSPIPIDVVYVDKNSNNGSIYVRRDLSSSSDTEIKILAGGDLYSIPPDHDFGKYILWSEYRAIYHMNNDPSSEQLEDATGNGNSGTYNGSMTSSDLVDGATDFDASDDYISIPDDPVLDDFNNITFSLWLYPRDDSQYNRVFGKSNSWDGAGYNFYFRGGQTGEEYSITINGETARGGDIILNEWQHIVNRYDNSDGMYLFRNGSQIATTQSTNLELSSGVDLQIGDIPNYTTDSRFDGIIGEVWITEIVRSNDWISARYNNLNSPSNFYSIS